MRNQSSKVYALQALVEHRGLYELREKEISSGHYLFKFCLNTKATTGMAKTLLPDSLSSFVLSSQHKLLFIFCSSVLFLHTSTKW